MSHPRFGVPTSLQRPRSSFVASVDDPEICCWCRREYADLDGVFCSLRCRAWAQVGSL